MGMRLMMRVFGFGVGDMGWKVWSGMLLNLCMCT